MKKFLGFTLSEVLIALAVIGIVASLVLPSLIAGQKATEAKAQFQTAYSILAKNFSDMDTDNVSILPSSYTASNTLYLKLMQYNKVVVNCGSYTAATKNDAVCISRSQKNTTSEGDNYTTFNGNTINMSRFDDGAFVINNGMLFAVENPGKDGYLWVSIDINGKNKKPNRWGWDLFTFELTKDGILPLGAPDTTALYSAKPETYCSSSETGNENGATCAYFAATRDDYFKKLYNGH
jgi:prepilin-type N-terminal cleavage/methylation domain-containing protein